MSSCRPSSSCSLHPSRPLSVYMTGIFEDMQPLYMQQSSPTFGGDCALTDFKFLLSRYISMLVGRPHDGPISWGQEVAVEMCQLGSVLYLLSYLNIH